MRCVVEEADGLERNNCRNLCIGEYLLYRLTCFFSLVRLFLLLDRLCDPVESRDETSESVSLEFLVESDFTFRGTGRFPATLLIC